ncbi:MAG: tRNA (adenosine(37)-N6)-dimethylallyltransferase MiaA, partial [Pedosphaera parvula]|nr:tRNA (adenosine(37)-N6)-dimethylallyltransferase MiaA [Pedosphaera parvula]
AMADIQARGQVPIFCGGTGLYFRAFLEGLGDSPPADPALRTELEAAPLPELLRELEQRDPETFRSIDRQNARRVVRALEVIRLTGKPFSAQRAPWAKPHTPHSAFRTPHSAFRTPHFYDLTRSPADLRARIDARVEDMFRRGLVEETRDLLARGLEQNRPAMQAIGYRQVVEHLRGVRSLPDTIALVKQRTRQFAKRQMTWIRHQLEVTWLALRSGDWIEDTVDRVVNDYSVAAGQRGR